MKIARFLVLLFLSAGEASSSATDLNTSHDGRLASAETTGASPSRPLLVNESETSAVREDVLSRLFHVASLVSAASDESLAYVISQTFADRLQTRSAILEFEEAQASHVMQVKSIVACE